MTTFGVKLRSDQMDCVIAVLKHVNARHEARLNETAKIDFTPIDRFAHQQSRDRITETLDVFLAVEHTV